MKITIKMLIALILVSLFYYFITIQSSAAGVFSVLKDDRDITIGRDDDIVYDFEYSNYLDRVVTNIVFEDTIPQGTKFVVASPWVCPGYNIGDTAPAGTVCTYDFGDINDGVVDQSITGIITLRVLKDTLLPSVTNTVRVLENGTDELATSTVTTPIVLPVVFGQISADPDEYACTDKIDFEIDLENVGLVDADDLKLTIQIPDNFKITSSGWVCNATNLCTYDYGLFEPGETDIVTLTIEVDDLSLCVTEQITLDLDLNVENPNEPEAFETVKIITINDLEASLKLEKIRSDLKTIEDDEEYIATIKIIVTNDGDYTINDIVINEDLDAALGLFDSYEYIKSWSDDCTVNGAFDGKNDIEIVNGLTLNPGEVCDIYYEVRLKDDEDEEYDVTSYAAGVVLGAPIEKDARLKFDLHFDNDDKKIQEKEEKRIKEDRERGNDDGKVLGEKIVLADTGSEIYLNIIIGSVILTTLAGYIYISKK